MSECTDYINNLKKEILALEKIKDKLHNQENIDYEINVRKSKILKCKENIEILQNNPTYHKLYISILNGCNPTRAVRELAEENYKNGIKPATERAIWNIYKKMQKTLQTSLKLQ